MEVVTMITIIRTQKTRNFPIVRKRLGEVKMMIIMTKSEENNQFFLSPSTRRTWFL
jgi:hypothetical protein